jgi:hypothetical protein
VKSPTSDSIARRPAALWTMTTHSQFHQYAFLADFISSLRSDVVASEWSFNENDIIGDKQHPTDFGFLDYSLFWTLIFPK